MSQQHRSAVFVGFLNVGAAGASTFALNTAPSGGFSASWLAFGWNPSESKTVNAIKAFVSAVAGTLAATDLVCDIYSDTAGTGPNASLASSSTVTATPTGAAWVEFTGFSLAITAGTQYWIVLRNANAAPATNAPTYRYGQNNAFHGAAQTSGSTWGSGCTRTSTNSGGAWSGQNGATGGWRVQYSDGTYDGLPFSNIAALAVASGTTGKQAVGIQFVSPSNGVLNIRGATMCFNKASTPGGAFFQLYNASTLIGTSSTIPAGNVTGTQMYPAYFSSTVMVQPGTTLNLVLCDATTADANTKGYTHQIYTIDNNANSFALMPFEGTARLATTTDYTVGAPSFATDQTQVVPFSLILDTDGEFGIQGIIGQTTGARSIGNY